MLRRRPGGRRKGLVHFTFSVSDAESGEIVTDAALELSTTPPTESGLTEASFQISKSELNPELYDIDVRLEAEGIWELESDD